MSLRELVGERHARAERHPFAKLLVSGGIDRRSYAEYLHNQLIAYRALESIASDIVDSIPGLARADSIRRDLEELGEVNLKTMQSTDSYVARLQSGQLTDQQLMAHVYVRHMGDLYGGQMIKKLVPGSGAMYNFEDRPGLIAAIRSRLSDDMAEEANLVFDFAIDLFEDLAREYNIPEADRAV